MNDDTIQDSLDLNFHTDMPVGEILRRTRVHYGQSLEQIESILRIRASQLEALEKGDISKLPGRVYAIGFVRSYSEYLGLDGDKMVHLFKDQSVGRKVKPDLSFPVPASESKVPGLMVIGGSLFGLVVLIGFVSLMLIPKKTETVVPPVPEELTTSQLNEAPALIGDALPQPAAETATQTEVSDPSVQKLQNRIQIEITDASWIEIKNASGVAILRKVLKPGDIYMVPPEPGLLMSTGNAGGLTIKVDGQPLPKFGEIGQIKRNIPLDSDKLSAQR